MNQLNSSLATVLEMSSAIGKLSEKYTCSKLKSKHIIDNGNACVLLPDNLIPWLPLVPMLLIARLHPVTHGVSWFERNYLGISLRSRRCVTLHVVIDHISCLFQQQHPSSSSSSSNGYHHDHDRVLIHIAQRIPRQEMDRNGQLPSDPPVL